MVGGGAGDTDGCGVITPEGSAVGVGVVVGVWAGRMCVGTGMGLVAKGSGTPDGVAA
jgi:hypothetical protein